MPLPFLMRYGRRELGGARVSQWQVGDFCPMGATRGGGPAAPARVLRWSEATSRSRSVDLVPARPYGRGRRANLPGVSGVRERW